MDKDKDEDRIIKEERKLVGWWRIKTHALKINKVPRTLILNDTL